MGVIAQMNDRSRVRRATGISGCCIRRRKTMRTKSADTIQQVRRPARSRSPTACRRANHTRREIHPSCLFFIRVVFHDKTFIYQGTSRVCVCVARLAILHVDHFSPRRLPLRRGFLLPFLIFFVLSLSRLSVSFSHKHITSILLSLLTSASISIADDCHARFIGWHRAFRRRISRHSLLDPVEPT